MNNTNTIYTMLFIYTFMQFNYYKMIIFLFMHWDFGSKMSSHISAQNENNN